MADDTDPQDPTAEGLLDVIVPEARPVTDLVKKAQAAARKAELKKQLLIAGAIWWVASPESFRKRAIPLAFLWLVY